MPLPPRTDEETKALRVLKKYLKSSPPDKAKMAQEPGFRQILAIGFNRFVLEEQAEFSGGE